MRNLESELYLVHSNARVISGKLSRKHYYDRNVGQLNCDVRYMVRRNQRQAIKGTKAKLSRNLTGPLYALKRHKKLEEMPYFTIKNRKTRMT